MELENYESILHTEQTVVLAKVDEPLPLAADKVLQELVLWRNKILQLIWVVLAQHVGVELVKLADLQLREVPVDLLCVHHPLRNALLYDLARVDSLFHRSLVANPGMNVSVQIR